MPNAGKYHGNDISFKPSPPPETNISSLVDHYADAAKRCGEPGLLPDGFCTREVSSRYRVPWAAKHENRTLAAVMAVRNMTEEDMKHFKEDLEKSAADWTRRQTEQANGGESEVGVAESNTEVATEVAGTDEARSRRTREEKLWTTKTKRISRRERKLSLSGWSLTSRTQTLKVREMDLSGREKSLDHRATRVSRREAELDIREDTLSRGEEVLRQARRRLKAERQSMAAKTDWTGASTNQGGAQDTTRQRKGRRPSRRIQVSIPESSRGRRSSITVKFD